MKDLRDLLFAILVGCGLLTLLFVGYSCSIYEECRTDPIGTANYDYCNEPGVRPSEPAR